MWKQRKIGNQYFLTTKTTDISAEQMFDLDFWQQKNLIIGSSIGRGKVYFLNAKEFSLDCKLVLRHYYRGGLFSKISNDKFLYSKLDKTRSFQEIKLLDILKNKGLVVPNPIAARVTVKNFYYQADIIIEYIENSQDLSKILQDNQLNQQVWYKIGKTIKQMHKLSLNHVDLNIHNILLQNYHSDKQNNDQLKCWLIDFDKCKFSKGNHWKKDNLARLHRSFIKEVERLNINFTAQNWQDFLNGYNL